VGAAALLAASLDDRAVAVRAAALAAVGGAFLIWLWLRHQRAAAFGAANSVTLARAALTVLLVALLGTAPTPALGCFALALAAAVLDGVDGPLARATGMTSAFGARFDMETDAALMLVLAALFGSTAKRSVISPQGCAISSRRAGASGPGAAPLSWRRRHQPSRSRCSARQRRASCRGAPRWMVAGLAVLVGRSPSTSTARAARASEAAMKEGNCFPRGSGRACRR
jgi:drug/metabolite transporter superfamily protein YnfA